MDLSAGDIAYEEEVARAPFVLQSWWTYLESKRKAPAKARNMLHERALKILPGSYKLWKSYLDDRRAQVRVNSLFALRVWSWLRAMASVFCLLPSATRRSAAL